MKRFLLCIVVFLFLFLTVGSYVVHAQPYDALLQIGGKWLKISGSVKGYDFGATGDSAATGQAYSEKFNQYAFVSYNPANAYATLDIYDKWGENTGGGTLRWISGTKDNWLAEIDIVMNLGANMIYATMPMLAKVKSGTEGAQKGTFKSITVRVLNDRCPTDEKHCGCVPILRGQINNYQKALELIITVSKRALEEK